MPLRQRAPTPARNEALASADTLHLILTQLLDINTVQACKAVCKAWRRACRIIKGWRAFRRKGRISLPAFRCARPWPCAEGGPCFVVCLPQPIAGRPPHPLVRKHGAAVFHCDGQIIDGLHRYCVKMYVVDIEDGRVRDSITLPMDFDWYRDANLLVEVAVCGTDPCPTLFVATRKEFCSFPFRGEGKRLADLSWEKIPYFRPSAHWRSICACPLRDRILVSDDENLLSYPVVTSGEPETAWGLPPTVLFQLPEQDWPYMALHSPGFQGLDCDAWHIALTCSEKNRVYLITHEGQLAKSYTGGGSLVAPFAVALSQRLVCVVDAAADDDRLVVLCRRSCAPLQMLRFGPTAVANIRSISLSPDETHLLLGDVHSGSVHVLLAGAHATRADDCICARPGQPAPHAVRGHGDGTLAQLEQLLSLCGDSGTPPGREFEEFEENPWHLAQMASEQFRHVECPRERMWMALCAFLFEHPAARSFLRIPPHVQERFWATERDRGASRLPMDRPGLKQLTLRLKPVRWQWVLGKK